MERKELNETLFTKAFETKAQRSLWIALGNSVNAYLWVGVQGVVAPEFIIRPNFLTSNSSYFNHKTLIPCKILGILL
ncbi:hypothetical protein MAL08_04690 [Leptospira noguchii]|uniref:hypothetical protein n=1 Tax=Leptospira noguchii TaxID=28182 RepID=UPI000345A155|nr:hypothetical protein [Leptospira noguchii]UOG38616.1 hypothetical protein MAL08_04690 [Leptospira noguchii]